MEGKDDLSMGPFSEDSSLHETGKWLAKSGCHVELDRSALHRLRELYLVCVMSPPCVRSARPAQLHAVNLSKDKCQSETCGTWLGKNACTSLVKV